MTASTSTYVVYVHMISLAELPLLPATTFLGYFLHSSWQRYLYRGTFFCFFVHSSPLSFTAPITFDVISDLLLLLFVYIWITAQLLCTHDKTSKLAANWCPLPYMSWVKKNRGMRLAAFNLAVCIVTENLLKWQWGLFLSLQQGINYQLVGKLPFPDFLTSSSNAVKYYSLLSSERTFTARICCTQMLNSLLFSFFWKKEEKKTMEWTEFPLVIFSLSKWYQSHWTGNTGTSASTTSSSSSSSPSTSPMIISQSFIVLWSSWQWIRLFAAAAAAAGSASK